MTVLYNDNGRLNPHTPYRRLVGSFTVGGNTVIQPTAIDVTSTSTGNITCPNHGLTTGDKIFLVVKDGSLPIVLPYELFSASISSINSFQAIVVDTNTFQVKIGSSGTAITFPSTNNTQVDATKFWFEKGCPSTITVSGLSNLSNIQIEFYGKMCNSSYNIYAKLFNNGTEITNIVGQTNNNYQTVLDSNWTADAVNVSGSLTVKNNGYMVDTFKTRHNTASSDYTYIQSNASLYYARYTTTNTKTVGFIPSTRTISSFTLCDSGSQSSSNWVGYGAFLNGFTVNVYKLGGWS